MISKALITGASSGIGEALAQLLASKGVHLILTGRNATKLEKVAKMTQAEKIIVADLNEHKGIGDVISVIKEELPDLVINNAGFGIYGDVLTTSWEEQDALVSVNALAPLHISIEATKTFVAAKKKGVIVNVSSVAGEHPTPGTTIYGASKSFVTMFSKAFHYEVSKKGVDVLVSCPGMVASDFANRAARKNVSLKGPIMTPERAAIEIWNQIVRRKQKWVFNRYYRWSSWFAKRFAPESVVMKLVSKRIKERL